MTIGVVIAIAIIGVLMLIAGFLLRNSAKYCGLGVALFGVGGALLGVAAFLYVVGSMLGVYRS